MTHFSSHPSRFAVVCGPLVTLWLGLSFAALAADSPRRRFRWTQIGDFTSETPPTPSLPATTTTNGGAWTCRTITWSKAHFDPTNHFVYPGMTASWYPLHGFLPVQPAIYRKTISIPASAKGKRLWLEFDGVFSNSRYWLNGRDIGSQYSGYTSSRFDITGAAECGGKNTLVVRVDPALRRLVVRGRRHLSPRETGDARSDPRRAGRGLHRTRGDRSGRRHSSGCGGYREYRGNQQRRRRRRGNRLERNPRRQGPFARHRVNRPDASRRGWRKSCPSRFR